MAVACRYRPADQRQRWLQNILLLGLLVILGRVFTLQVLARGYYLEEVAPIVDSNSPSLGAQPGAILARDLQPLAESVLVRTLIADPVMMTQEKESLEGVAHQLSSIVKLPEADLYQKLYKHRLRRYVELGCFLPASVSEQIDALQVKGLFLRAEWKRDYPQEALACHIIGGRDRFHHALGGLEHLYRPVLDPQPEMSDSSKRSGLYDRASLRSEPGRDLLLTVDLALQRQVEAELDRLVRREDPKWVTALVVDPRTGAVLAIASRPGYNPNDYIQADRKPGEPRRVILDDAIVNVPVVTAVEQGSTFKIMLIAAALEAGVVTPHTTFHCPGRISIGGRPISCWGRYATTGHGRLDMYGMIGQSCNVIAARVALLLGEKRYMHFLRSVGIGVDPEAGFPAETFGVMPTQKPIPARDLANMGFGQCISCSNLQLSAAVAGIVNGGMMKQPHLVDRILDSDGSLFRQPLVGETRVCSAATSATVRSMLAYAVEHGTGSAVAMPDVRVGGKTGTAQQWDLENNRHYTDRYMVSFVEVVPIDQPRYVIHVACDEPKVGRHGSDVAAPACKRIAEYLMRRMDLLQPPSPPAGVQTAHLPAATQP